MSYGKLVVRMEVLDPTVIGEDVADDDVCSRRARQVMLLSRHSVTHAAAHKIAWAFIEANVPKQNWGALDVMWYPEPVRIGTWHV